MIDLTEQEKIILQVFANDLETFNVVFKIAKDEIGRAKDGFIRSLTTDKSLPNEEVGAKIRAFDEATLLVEKVFRDLAQYHKSEEIVPLDKNPGR